MDSPQAFCSVLLIYAARARARARDRDRTGQVSSFKGTGQQRKEVSALLRPARRLVRTTIHRVVVVAHSVLLNLDSARPPPSGDAGCFSGPLHPPFLQRTLLEVASAYEETMQLVRDCRAQCDMPPLGDEELDSDEEEDGSGEKEKEEKRRDSSSTARLLFGTQKPSTRASRVNSIPFFRTRHSTGGGTDTELVGMNKGELKLLHIHSPLSPLYNILSLLRGMSKCGQKHATESSMFLLTTKLKKMVALHLQRWEGHHDRQHMMRSEQKTWENQYDGTGTGTGTGGRRSYLLYYICWW